MAVPDEQRLITPISQRQFELHALSLDRGPNFDPAQIFGAYQAGRGSVSGCILVDPGKGTFTSLALRRRVDHRWVKIDECGAWSTPEAAPAHDRQDARAHPGPDDGALRPPRDGVGQASDGGCFGQHRSGAGTKLN